MIHELIPENHRFRYHRSENPRADFLRRLDRHSAFATALDHCDSPLAASQFLVGGEAVEFEDVSRQIRSRGQPLHICRSTSPLDGTSVWLEILDHRASKSQGAAWLAGREKVERGRVFAIGNDYNDVDLLEWAGRASVVDNAPDPLLQRFHCVPTNDQEGFTAGVSGWLSDLTD